MSSPAPIPDKIPLAEQISEVKRELSMRAFAYPRFVMHGTLKQHEADRRMRRLEAVLDTLVSILVAERLL